MSIQPEYDRRTADRTPDTHQLAAELGVDATLLREFVRHHPRPTAAIVLGWVHRQGGDAEPDRHADDVEAWLGGRETATPRPTAEDEEAIDDLLDGDGRIGAEGWR